MVIRVQFVVITPKVVGLRQISCSLLNPFNPCNPLLIRNSFNLYNPLFEKKTGLCRRVAQPCFVIGCWGYFFTTLRPFTM